MRLASFITGIFLFLTTVSFAQSTAQTRSYATSLGNYQVFDGKGMSQDSGWTSGSTGAITSSQYDTSMGLIQNRTEFYSDFSGLRGLVKNSMLKTQSLATNQSHTAAGYGSMVDYGYGSVVAVGAAMKDVFTAGNQDTTLSFKVTLHSIADHDSTATSNSQTAGLNFTAYAELYGSTTPYYSGFDLAHYHMSTGEQITTRSATIRLAPHAKLDVFLGLGLADTLVINHNSATGSYFSELNAMSTGKIEVSVVSGSFNTASGYRYGATSTPEPATMGLFALVGLTALRKRRR